MPRVRCLLVSLMLLSPSAGELSAEEANLLQGARVRVNTVRSGVLLGSVAAADADTLTIDRAAGGGMTQVARTEIVSLDVSRGFRRHTVKGLLGGALAWAAVVGLYAVFDTLDESGVGEPLFIGGMLAAGGLVGTLVKTEQWERPSTAAVSVRLSARGRGVQAQVVVAF